MSDTALRRITFETIDSTNAAAERFVLEHADEPWHAVLFVAHEQTAGRGQRERTWQSPRGGAWFSLLLRRGVADELAALTAARAVRAALRRFVSAERLGLKPPNDVLLDERKVCGVLCKQTVRGRSGAAARTEVRGTPDAQRLASLGAVTLIVGVGINVNNDPAALGPDLRRPATSLREARGGEDVSVDAVIEVCVETLREAFEM